MKKRRGRPIKPATGKRTQVTTLIRADLKRQLMNEAKQNGRTLSAEIEHWLERTIAYESLAKAFARLQAGPKSLGEQFREAFASLQTDTGQGLREDLFTKLLAQGGSEDDEGSK